MLRLLLLALAVLVALLLAVAPARAEEVVVRLTWYTDCCLTYSGSATYPGVAACSWGWAIGARLVLPDGMRVTCLDRGRLGGGLGHIDVWVPSRAAGRALTARYGDWTTVEVIPREAD
jgi:hypothetical protein